MHPKAAHEQHLAEYNPIYPINFPPKIRNELFNRNKNLTLKTVLRFSSKLLSCKIGVEFETLSDSRGEFIDHGESVDFSNTKEDGVLWSVALSEAA
jgi:hypothetical protein